MDSYSFYYRSSLDLNKYYPNAEHFSLLYPDDNIVIENGVMRLNNPEAFNPLRINNIVRVYPHKYDYFKIEVKIRCWEEGDLKLKEVTKFSGLKRSLLYQIIWRCINKLYKMPFNVLLGTINGVSYYSKNGFLIKTVKGKTFCQGRLPRIEDPVYYEFVSRGEEAFLRTGNHIYASKNGMTNWELIYEGKRAIKNSMLWIEEDNSLLFTEYTPGLDLTQHHIFKYNIINGTTTTVMTFYTPLEHKSENKKPYCRHIHVMMRDPFTKDIYLGVGDSDDESAIYRSINNGNSFELLGYGLQTWRTLSFFFTDQFVYWNTDSPDPQYINCLNRKDILEGPVPDDKVVHYPLFNSACWNSIFDDVASLYVMSASCEGTLYDNMYRVYGIDIQGAKPKTFCLFEQNPHTLMPPRSAQLFLLGKDNHGVYWFYDTFKHYYRQFKLKKNIL
jgi:hypothetical protein